MKNIIDIFSCKIHEAEGLVKTPNLDHENVINSTMIEINYRKLEEDSPKNQSTKTAITETYRFYHRHKISNKR